MSTLSTLERGRGNNLLQLPVSQLSQSTIKELRSALTEQMKQPNGPTPELARLLKRVAAEARQNNIRPEELLVIFKQLWNSVAESLRPQNAEQHERVRQNLVTLCIQAYYAD
ncbi:MAG TPA: hypothetical protein VJX16_28310 [Terriglobales bacterium]|nr:hypothetical protein [Terriglobales bacterium]